MIASFADDIGIRSTIGAIRCSAANASIRRIVFALPITLPVIRFCSSSSGSADSVSGAPGIPTRQRVPSRSRAPHPRVPVERGVGSDEQEVDNAARERPARVDEVGGSEREGELLLRPVGIEGDHRGTERGGEAHGEVAEAADADDADARARPDAEPLEGREHRQPGAEERRCRGSIELRGELEAETRIAAHAVGEAARTSHAGADLPAGAQVLALGPARAARAARSRLPAEPDEGAF